ncbi:hypothetical protein T261_2147 [Streptomyces lydicus]|nr:hypothetical protein T261_2147 [Streptomyces lydicus]
MTNTTHTTRIGCFASEVCRRRADCVRVPRSGAAPCRSGGPRRTPSQPPARVAGGCGP